MAFKKPGRLDFINGDIGYFLTYCDHCNKKIIRDRKESQELISAFHWAVQRSERLPRKIAKAVLTRALEKL